MANSSPNYLGLRQERDKKIFTFFLLLGGRKEYGSLTKTAKAFGLSRERVRQIVARLECYHEMQKNGVS